MGNRTVITARVWAQNAIHIAQVIHKSLDAEHVRLQLRDFFGNNNEFRVVAIYMRLKIRRGLVARVAESLLEFLDALWVFLSSKKIMDVYCCVLNVNMTRI
jgi:hypothetical protein